MPSPMSSNSIGSSSVRLNLINHVLALFRDKFAYNTALRNPVLRWESCKDSVWESVKKCSRLCSEAGTRLDLAGGSRLASRQKVHTRKACRGAKQLCQLEHYRTKIQTGHSVSLRLKLATQSSRKVKSPVSPVLEKLILRIPFLHQYKYPSFPQNMCGYSERKTLREVSSKHPPN